jgi:hypothetical protein
MSRNDRKLAINFRFSPRRRKQTAVLLMGLCTVSMAGCKTPLGRPLDSEPSFDRLLESERKQGGRTASYGPTTGLQSEQKRPGQARFAADSRSRQELPETEPPAELALDREQAIDTLTRSEQRVPRDEAALSRMMEQTQQAVASQYTMAGGPLSRTNPASRTGRPTDSQRASTNKRSISDTDAGRPNQNEADTDFEDADDEAVVTFRMNDDTDDTWPDEPLPKRPTRDTVPRSYTAVETSDAVDRNLDPRESEVVAASHARKSTPTSTRDSVADSPTQAAAASSDLSWEDHVREAVYQLEQTSEVALSPGEQVRRAAIARLLSMTAGDIEAAMQPIEGLQTTEQEYYRHQFKALYDTLDPSGTPVASRRWSLAMLSQRKAHDNLAAVSNLEVNNAAFCTSVESFGVVEEFPANNFKPDQEFLLYCEIDNFVSEQVKAGGYETQLQGNYEIVDTNGRRVAYVDLPMDSHICRNRRRDYFIAYRMHMPQNISPGKYTLKLTIEDMKGPKFGQAELPFQIVN